MSREYSYGELEWNISYVHIHIVVHTYMPRTSLLLTAWQLNPITN